jgi:2-dehydro-3-deoxygluconokinase
MANRILVVGEVMLDVLAATAERHGDIRVRAGGTAVNAALAAAAGGAAVVVAGRVGDDAAAHAVRRVLEEAGIDDRLVTDPDAATGTYVEIAELRFASRGANARLAPADVPAGDFDAVLVSGYVAVHDDTLAAARHALARPARWRAVTATPLAHADFAERVDGANVIFANAAEAAAAGSGYEIVCITDGERGATVTRGGETTQVAPTGVAGTGAGDAFAGAYLARL